MEGEVRIKALKEHMEAYHCKNSYIWLSEDATRVIRSIDYDKHSNSCVGFVLPLDNDGLPVMNSFPFTSVRVLEDYLENYRVSEQVYAIMAQPLSPNVPPMCLCLYGSDNQFTAQEVTKRWDKIMGLCKGEGIQVLGISSDGDPKLLKSMLLVSGLFRVLTNNDWKTAEQSSDFDKLGQEHWNALKWNPKLLTVQDTVHIGAKLRCRLLKPGIVIQMGCYNASIDHLKYLVRNYGRELHTLRDHDLCDKDKMNYAAVEHMTATSTLSLLEKHEHFKATLFYLKIMKYVTESFLVTMSPLARVKSLWTAIFFIRYWRYWIRHVRDPMENDNVRSKELPVKHYTLKNNFITSNAYTCIEINGHALLLLIMHLKNTPLSFLPKLIGSQQCEQLFHACRSATPIHSTCVNFSVLSLMQRLNRLEIEVAIKSGCNKNSTLNVPRLKKHSSLMTNVHNDASANSLPSMPEILSTVLEAKKDALKMLDEVGILTDLQKLKKNLMTS